MAILPLLLLHPSLRSAAMQVPWMQTLGRHLHVLAIDTPGHGGSAALAPVPTRMADHAGPLCERLLDNAAHFDDGVRAQMPEFFPWFSNDQTHRIVPGPPPADACMRC